eukprot:13809302-Alexandrium_andersonii.AAC.1
MCIRDSLFSASATDSGHLRVRVNEALGNRSVPCSSKAPQRRSGPACQRPSPTAFQWISELP